MFYAGAKQLTSDPLELFFYLLSHDFKVTSRFSSGAENMPRHTTLVCTRYRRVSKLLGSTQVDTTKLKTHNKPTPNSNMFFNNNVSLRFSVPEF